jgi:chromosome segregation ATPase
MNYTKKYLNFLFLTALLLQSFHMMSCELGYVGGPSAHDISEVGTGLSEIFRDSSTVALDTARENPAIVVTAILAGSLFMAKDKISHWAEEKCKNIESKIEQECKNKAETFGQSSMQNKALLFALKPFAIGCRDYCTYSKFHIALAGIFASAGYISGHQIIGGCFSSIPLVKAWFDRIKMEMFERFDGVDKAVAEGRAENKKLHEEAQRKLNGIDGKIDNVKLNIDEMGTKLEGMSASLATNNTAIQSLETNFNIRMKTMSEQLTAIDKNQKGTSSGVVLLADEIKSVQSNIEALKKDNKVTQQQYNIMIEQVESLHAKLKVVTNANVAMQAQQSKLFQILTNKVQELTENTANQLGEIRLQIDGQQTDLKTVEAKTNKLLEDATSKNEVLQSLNNLCNVNKEQLLNLNNQVKNLSEKDETKQIFLEQIRKAQEKNVIIMLEHMTALDEKQSQINDSFGGFYSKIDMLENEVLQLKRQMTDIKKDTQGLSDQVTTNHAELVEKNEALTNQIKSLTEQLKKQEEKTQDILNKNIRFQNQILREVSQFKEDQQKIEEKRKRREKELKRKLEENTQLTRETNNIAKGFTGQRRALQENEEPSFVPLYPQNTSPFWSKQVIGAPQQYITLAAVASVAWQQQNQKNHMLITYNNK